MLQFHITNEDILTQIKLACRIPQITKEILRYKVIEDAATEAGIKIKIPELQKAANKFRVSKQLLTAKDTWKWLEKHSLSLEDFEKVVYKSLISAKLAAHLFADKIEPYFYEHKLDYASVAIYEVIFDDEDLALELFYTIQEDEMSFSDVAHKYIQDTELRRKGGYRGILRRQDLKPEISAAVFAAKPPQLLKPIVTSKGVHLIFVEEIIQAQLDNKLRNSIGSYLFNEWLKQEVAKFEII
jgi:parvulin-like peptidyl-prolyl isomerase